MTDKETDLHDQREQIAKAARSFYALANDLSANGAVLPSQAALALATAGAHALRDVFGETLAAEIILKPPKADSRAGCDE